MYETTNTPMHQDIKLKTSFIYKVRYDASLYSIYEGNTQKVFHSSSIYIYPSKLQHSWDFPSILQCLYIVQVWEMGPHIDLIIMFPHLDVTITFPCLDFNSICEAISLIYIYRLIHWIKSNFTIIKIQYY